jgi:hypothetical protein
MAWVFVIRVKQETMRERRDSNPQAKEKTRLSEKSLNCIMQAKANLTAIRTKLYDYIRIADEKKLYAMYYLLEPQTGETYEWWKDKELISEFDSRSKALETGADKGFTLDELKMSIKKLKKDRYGK